MSKNGRRRTACLAFGRRIQFHAVSFRYQEEWVLQHVNLTIAAGQVVALVGPSGGGKSTLADLIPRFYDVSAGQITTDGTDIRNLTLASLRSQIAVVTQTTFLFNDTVRNNIAYGMPERPEEEIIAAAKAAHATNSSWRYRRVCDPDWRAGAYSVRRPAPTTRHCACALEKRAGVNP